MALGLCPHCKQELGYGDLKVTKTGPGTTVTACEKCNKIMGVSRKRGHGRGSIEPIGTCPGCDALLNEGDLRMRQGEMGVVAGVCGKCDMILGFYEA